MKLFLTISFFVREIVLNNKKKPFKIEIKKQKQELNRLVPLLNRKYSQLFKILSTYLVLLEQLVQNQSSYNFHLGG